MTYQAHNKPKFDSFSRIISFLTTFFQIIRIYVQSVHNGFDVMQGHHLGGGGWKGLWTPQGFTILVFFSVNRTFKTVLLLQK